MLQEVKYVAPDGKEITEEEANRLVAESGAEIQDVVPELKPELAPVKDAYAEEPPQKTVPLAALQEERKRRQSLEKTIKASESRQRELDELRRRSAASAGPVSYDDVTDFPGLGKKFEEQLKGTDTYTRSVVSQELARMKFDDYDDVVNQSGVMTDISTDPVLAEYLASQPMPAFAAYEIGVGRLGPQRLEEIRAKGRQEGAKMVVQRLIKNADAPVTLANAPVGSPAGPDTVTAEKALNMTDEEFAALPPATKERLLRGGN